MMKSILTTCLICLTVAACAQSEQSTFRERIVLGASLGVSHTIHSFPANSQTNTDFGFDFEIGYMVKPNLALLLTSNVSGYDYEGTGRARKRDFGVLAPTVQYWFHDRIWALAGAGLGVDAPVFFDIKDPDDSPEEIAYYTGLGVVGAIGYDFYQGKKFTLDVKARVTYRNVNLTEGKATGIAPSVLVGINF